MSFTSALQTTVDTDTSCTQPDQALGQDNLTNKRSRKRKGNVIFFNMFSYENSVLNSLSKSCVFH